MLETVKNWFSSTFEKERGLPLTDEDMASLKGNKPYFNRFYSAGVWNGVYGDTEIYLIDPVKKVKYPIVDEIGNFVNFPGIEDEHLLKPHYTGTTIDPIVEFRSDFIRDNITGKLMIKWQLQPDGWFWADEGGFGAEKDDEIILYAFLTEDGKFEGPFRIYSVGKNKYYGVE